MYGFYAALACITVYITENLLPSQLVCYSQKELYRLLISDENLNSRKYTAV